MSSKLKNWTHTQNMLGGGGGGGGLMCVSGVCVCVCVGGGGLMCVSGVCVCVCGGGYIREPYLNIPDVKDTQ